MTLYTLASRTLTAALAAFAFTACTTDNPDTTAPQLRKPIAYTALTDTMAYTTPFVDDKGASTVDLTNGANRLLMFRAINTYNTGNVSAGTPVDAAVLKNMFANTNSPFSGTLSSLNTSGVQLRNVTASSLSNGEQERQAIEANFTTMANASKSLSAVAAEGKAGKLGTYLVDERGIEWAQIIQKGLIGAFQLDYMANVLLSDKNLSADNTTLVAGKNYTQLEQNWDELYGMLTPNARYGSKATSTSSGESFIGSYVWEYNKDGFARMHPALLKGRAAIVNNDMATLKAQATLIRTELEKAIANSALGYLAKWKTGATDAARAHAIGEGLGFIYSMRYAKLAGADAAFSDGVLNNLVNSAPNGFWGLTNTKIDAAATAIRTKFNIAN